MGASSHPDLRLDPVRMDMRWNIWWYYHLGREAVPYPLGALRTPSIDASIVWAWDQGTLFGQHPIPPIRGPDTYSRRATRSGEVRMLRVGL